jgi:catechol 2,3-dioxygenase-like lactoylglutathione lyase family enzyme
MNIQSGTETYDVGGVRYDRPFKIRRLGHTGLFITSYDATIDFYTRILGMRATDQFNAKDIPQFADLKVEDGRSAFLTYGSDHHALVLVHKSLEFLLGGSVPEVTLNQITWQVGTLAEVAEGAKFVIERGAKLVRRGRDLPGSNWAVYFRGPDAHINELYYGIEQIGWNRKSKPKELYHLSFDGEISLPQPSERKEIATAAESGVDIDTGYQTPAATVASYNVGGVMLAQPFKIVRLGPLRLFVEDVEQMVQFYTDMMGLTLTEEIVFEGMKCSFLRAGSEHHSIALYPLELRERLGFSEHSRCMSIGFQLGSYQQLRDALRFVEEQGCTIIDLPAELRPGIDYAVHVRDPEGHCVQLYYYMEQIGWDGKPRPAHLRRRADGDWPDLLDPVSDTFADHPFMGPLE